MEKQNQPAGTACATISKSSKIEYSAARDFVAVISRLCAAYPRYRINAATVALYHERLERFSVEDLSRAINIWIDNNDEFPAISDLKSLIQGFPKKKPPILLEERPDPEVVKKARQFLTDLIEEKSIPRTADDEGARRKHLREQAALLRKQEAAINGKEKAS